MPDPAALRATLLDQIAYLIDEIEMQKRLIDRVPQPVLEGRPTPDAFTIKEIYGILALRDERVHGPLVEQAAVGEKTPVLPQEDVVLATASDWNAEPTLALLSRVQYARRAIVRRLQELDVATWQTPVRLGDERLHLFALAHQMTQQDTDRLRELGYRLHESNLTQRQEDLPK